MPKIAFKGDYKRIVFRCEKKVADRLEELANLYGVTVNAMCSYIIGSHLHAYAVTVQPVLDAMPAQFKSMIASMGEKIGEHDKG